MAHLKVLLESVKDQMLGSMECLDNKERGAYNWNGNFDIPSKVQQYEGILFSV